MELNIDTSNNPQVATKVASEKTKGTRGKWRKRRRAQVIERSKLTSRFKQHQKKSKAQLLQAEEFDSGRQTAPKGAENNEDASDAHANKKRKLKSGSGDGVADDAKRAEKFVGGNKVKKRTKSSSGAPKGDQTPQAIEATLRAIGSSSFLESAQGEEIGESRKEEVPKKKNSPEEEDEEVEEEIEAIPNENEAKESFDDIGLYHSIEHHLKTRMDILKPTQVQKDVLLKTLDLPSDSLSVDLLIRSPTGSGKTFAYLFPIAHYLLHRSKRITREDGSLALIIVPTHELAEQVCEQARLLFQPWHWIVVGKIIGGENKRSEKARLRKGISILVSTPGRLLDHMRNTQSFQYAFCEFLVLDEADKLLELGFESDLKEIIHNLDNQAKVSNPDSTVTKMRSNFLLSATLTNNVEQLAKYSLQNPTEIIVSTTAVQDEKNTTKFSMPSLLHQHYCIVEQKYRLITLSSLLRLRALKDVTPMEMEVLPPCKVIVFFSTCDSVDFHHDVLISAGLPKELKNNDALTNNTDLLVNSNKLVPLDIYKLHGNHSQTERAKSLREFRKNPRAILLCTDVAARGLDFKGLTFTIQYDPPTGGEGEELEYLHRAGRSGRMGNKGDALLFLLPSEEKYVSRLKKNDIVLNEISSSAAIAACLPNANLADAGGISYATRLVTSSVQNELDALLSDNEPLKARALAGFQAYCRAYATHSKDVRHYFHVRNLHLGHVARSFILSDKPAEFNEMMSEIESNRKNAKKTDGDDSDADSEDYDKVDTDARKHMRKLAKSVIESSSKGEIARAIAEGERQPFNLQNTELSRRRREKGRGTQAYKEMALEFGG